jgi:pimeloyl-ACP methyl ester carboxylesterase
MIKNKLLAISVVAILVCMTVASLVNNNFGALKIRDVYYPDATGNIMHAEMFIPKGVTAKNPAPTILTMHGGGACLKQLGNFHLELARRGYIVFAVDASGSGFSDYTRGNINTKPGQSSGVKNDGGAINALKYLINLDIVDKKNIGLMGHSMGGTYCAIAAESFPDNVKAILPWGSGSFLDYLKKTDPKILKYNIGYINAAYDEMVIFSTHLNHTAKLLGEDFLMKAFGQSKPLLPGKVYGTFDDRNARVIYTPPASHCGNAVSQYSIGCVLDFFQKSIPAPNHIDSAKQIWKIKELFSILAMIGLTMFIVGLAMALLKSKFFSSLTLGPLSETVKMSAGFKWTGIVLLVVVPMLTLYPLGLWAASQKPSILFPMTWANVYAVFSVVNAVIFLALFLVWHFISGKKKNGNILTYGLSIDNKQARVDFRQVGKAALLAVFVLSIAYLLIDLTFNLFHLDFRFWFAAIMPLTLLRIQYISGYLVLFTVFCGVMAVVNTNFAGMNDGASGHLAALKQYGLSLVIGVGGITIIMLIFYFGLRINKYPPFFIPYPPFATGHPNSLVISQYLFEVVPLFSLATTASTALYRKTRNIYVGWFICALWLTLIMVAGNGFTY